MGLDQYAFTSPQRAKRPVDFDPHDNTLIHRWRKHPNLHGWMEELYAVKGGAETFNCASVVLTTHDLDDLEAAINAGALPVIEGFCFGTSTGEERDDDLAFIAKARAALAAGLTVFYTSWW